MHKIAQHTGTQLGMHTIVEGRRGERERGTEEAIKGKCDKKKEIREWKQKWASAERDRT